MKTLWTAAIALTLSASVGVVASAAAQPIACRAVDCSGAGVCMAERSRPFCLCDDGFAAAGLSCVPVQDPTPMWLSQPSAAVGTRIVEIALSERGHGSREVGAALDRYPYGLGHYLAPGEWWCSDFVAWVYRAADAPLTGGSEGGWLVGNNYAIKAWFERHGLWVAKGGEGWESFEPRPGDYMRLHTQRGGHSAIVRYVDGTTLYTVEGNVGNRVRLGRYDDYHNYARIDGFGTVTVPLAP